MTTFEYEEPNDFSQALMNLIDDQHREEWERKLDNDLYERSSE